MTESDRRVRHALSGFHPERVQLIEVRSRIEFRVLDAGNHQRRDRQIGIRAQSGVCKTANQLFSDHRS